MRSESLRRSRACRLCSCGWRSFMRAIFSLSGAYTSMRSTWDHSFEANVLAASTATTQGHYVLIAELVPPKLSERVPGDILWTLKLGTILSALICFLIAHYLSKPIERLRDATHELARGNLDIRAGENLGNRRDE